MFDRYRLGGKILNATVQLNRRSKTWWHRQMGQGLCIRNTHGVYSSQGVSAPALSYGKAVSLGFDLQDQFSLTQPLSLFAVEFLPR